ncbi:Interleukin-3 receptor class 2 subunit beta [Channa argus]|uniref:Interleukin-3 receptor class 2 subunit beta n=1 Tax=Channa argus TaxID=215402 RepID=A0A6G1QCP5_CHAAH|nr:Interleukin-3 receptor class 2 subunit beta [Channa argus]KAK2894074.1 hypothetical protein Q8A73_016558 [Channa argus]
MGSKPTLSTRMMHLFWVVFWSVHPLPALLSGPDHFTVQESNVSPLLKSLHCHNDYEANVYCEWRDHTNEPLQLWSGTSNNRTLCVPYSPPVQDQPGTVHCKYKADAFSIGTKHTVFFLRNDSVPSSVPQQPVGLFQHLRARTPVKLSTHDAGDEGRRLTWSSPYPSSSALNKELTYQLRFRTDRQNSWTTKDVTNTSVTLEKHLLRPGHSCEAKVRARASMGQWSDWSPVVSWHIEQDPEQPPSLHCVLNSETEVVCSWEVSRQLAHLITYQLHCRHNHTAPPERCCESPTSDLSGTLLRYSCLLNVTEPEHTLLELLPTPSARTFKMHQHIRPKPPQRVEVKDRADNWIVKWTEPSTASIVSLYYQVCYYRTQDQTCTPTDVPDLSFTIPAMLLVPSQTYQVKVRSLVVPGEGPSYGGIPSEWTDPKEWTSHPATWSFTNFLYILISVFVAALFLSFYCTFPTCQRKVILWVDSVPSPGKSKILSDIKSATSRPIVQSEDTFICKVLDTVSTCSSEASLWPNLDTVKKRLEPDEGFWNCDNLGDNLTERITGLDTSSMSFSGPYILCQSDKKSTNTKTELKEKEDKASSNDPASPMSCLLYGEGYVCLPSRTTSRSTQDLVSHSDSNQNTQMHDSAEQTEQQCPDATLRDQPPAYASRPLSSWPQGGHMPASGYCVLPKPQ